MNISEHISLDEATYSDTAKIRGLKNIPTPTALENMKALSKNIFEPLRAWVGEPIRVNSFYRSTQVNSAVGGSINSQHRKGEAMDIDDVWCQKTNAEMFWWIAENRDFDQLIWEFGNSLNPDWVHVSFKKNGVNRRILTKATRKLGRAHYKRMQGR